MLDINWFRLKSRWARLQRSRFINHGVPFLILMAAASFALSKFTVIRYEIQHYSKESLKKLERMGIKPGEPLSDLDTVFEEMTGQKRDDYENVRGPREYEDNLEALDLLKKKIRETRERNPNVHIQTAPHILKEIQEEIQKEENKEK
ncbi:cytochrome c oxidase assembly protein COX16 homolog l(3)neo43 [Brevipalpus obovatus]|uniref:cytochrome c oxidase assembly protein COX16 homolog l(3)neo43 n=1 Tax=Brevipalpus obovatus TaxID=246614 RepID=UPI003D9DE00F